MPACGVLHAQQAQHDAVIDERHGEQGAGGVLQPRLAATIPAARVASPSTSSGSAREISQPNKPASMGLSRDGQPDLLALVHADVQQATLAIDEHEVQLVEAEQRARLGQDALGELVDPARALQREAGFEQARERPALRRRRIALRADAVEAQHEQQHQAREQSEHRAIAGVVEHRRQHAGRHEDEIRERITGRDDAPHVAAVEAEEQRSSGRRSRSARSAPSR